MRKGEKFGWIVGWIGSFLWLLALSLLWLIQNNTIFGLLGIVVFFIALFFIVFLEPSRHPRTKYWKLLLPNYILLFIAICIAVSSYGGLRKLGLSIYAFFWIIPLLLPLLTMGNKTWNDRG